MSALALGCSDMRGYICSYTKDGVHGGGNGAGITRIAFDPGSGRIDAVKNYPGACPTWLEIAQNGKHAYAVNDIDHFAGARQGGVTAFAVDGEGDLIALNTVASGGIGPAHCSVHPSGRFVLVANYASGHLAVLPIRADGSLGDATDVKAPPGAPGPKIAAHAPPGSFARSGHDASH